MSTLTDKDTLLNAALEFGLLGFPVIPLHNPLPDGSYSCCYVNDKSIGKHPRTPNGLKDATTDLDIIESWWKQWPDANIGIVTGSVSGIEVLDVDPRHNGDKSLEELQCQFGPLPLTLKANTGGGGNHYIFKATNPPNKNRTAMRPGLDWRGEGGYIVAPPSLHASGKGSARKIVSGLYFLMKQSISGPFDHISFDIH